MKILFVTHYGGYYGANKSLLYLANDLKTRYGVEPVIICMGEGMLNEEAKKLGVSVISYKYYGWLLDRKCYGSNFKRNVCKLLNALYYFPKIKYELKHKKFEIVHCNTSLSNLGALLAINLKIPLVWHIREFGDSDYDLKYTYSVKKVSRIYRKANTIVTISQSLDEYFIKKYNVGNTRVIYNGIESFNVEKNHSEKIRFCCVGALGENKRQLDILKAGKQLLRESINDFEIHFFGDGNAAYKEILYKYVKKNILEKHVFFHGYQDNVLSHLNKMDVGVMASTNEAFGRVTVEYMYARMPVIGTNTGGTPEIIKHDFTGCLYKPGDIAELVNCMKRYIEEPDLIEKEGNNGYKVANQNFTMEQNTDNIYSLYEEILSKGRY